MKRPGATRGFTLIELLIALALFSIMSLLAWRGLDTVLQSRASVEAPGRAALELAAAWTQLEADLIAARAVTPSTVPAARTQPVAAALHIVASAQQLALLRAPAHCAGCWEGVVYDIAQRDGEAVLRRRSTTAVADAKTALFALNALTAITGASNATTSGVTEHIVLRGASAMRIDTWRTANAATGPGVWAPLAASSTPIISAAPAGAQQSAKAALKVQWQLGKPWDGWVSKVVLLENRW